MANATVGVGTYAGEAAVLTSLLRFCLRTLSQMVISPYLENVHSKAVFASSQELRFVTADCTFTTPASGQLTLGEAVLEAAAFKVNEQVCNKDLRATWESAQMRGQSSCCTR